MTSNEKVHDAELLDRYLERTISNARYVYGVTSEPAGEIYPDMLKTIHAWSFLKSNS
jgi:hypothetical protein